MALVFAVSMALLCRIRFQMQEGVQITVLDVGQGDGIHIRNSSFNCLIDGGSSDISSVELIDWNLIPLPGIKCARLCIRNTRR